MYKYLIDAENNIKAQANSVKLESNEARENNEEGIEDEQHENQFSD